VPKNGVARTCPEEHAEMCLHCESCSKRAAEQIFKKRMVEAEQRTFIETPDDGNCMFYAIAAAYRSYLLGSWSPSEQYKHKMRLYNFGHNGRQYRQEAARILESLLKGIDFKEKNRFPPVDKDSVRIMIFSEMLPYGDYAFEDSQKWQQRYLDTLKRGAHDGDRNSIYWGGSPALAALAAYLDVQILIYNAKGEPPAHEVAQTLTPAGWTDKHGTSLMLWFHKDDGSVGRGGTHYDAFTAPGGPDPRLGSHW